jgi:hypothetical protein
MESTQAERLAVLERYAEAQRHEAEALVRALDELGAAMRGLAGAFTLTNRKLIRAIQATNDRIDRLEQRQVSADARRNGGG